MHSAVQTAFVTIISYKPLSGLNFARYTGQYGSYMPSSPLGVYKPLGMGDGSLKLYIYRSTSMPCVFGCSLHHRVVMVSEIHRNY